MLTLNMHRVTFYEKNLDIVTPIACTVLQNATFKSFSLLHCSVNTPVASFICKQVPLLHYQQ